MLKGIIDFSIKNRMLVVLSLLAIFIIACLILPKLNMDAFPDVTNIQVQVNTEAPGLASREVEQLITYPVESVMYSLPDVEEVRSISKTGLSAITVVFKEGTNIYFAREQVFQQLQAAKEEIPNGVGTPKIGPNTSGLGQIFQYILISDDINKNNVMSLRSLNDWLVKLQLLPVGGITDVLSFGGKVKQYQVQLNPQKLLSYNIHTDDVVSSIENNNRNSGGWYLNTGDEQLVIRGVGWLQSGNEGLTEIGNIAIKESSGTVVRVKDVARVLFAPEIRQGAVSMTVRTKNGKPKNLGEVVTGIVLKRIGANTKATIDAIKIRIPGIQQSLPKGVKIQTVYDQADLVNKAVDTVAKALIEAFILILVVLYLFLNNIRATLLVLISVPISILIALIVMAQWGISANLMSLGGLAIAIGTMVDGSVVMMENIFKNLEKRDLNSNLDRTSDVSACIKKSAQEVARPVFFAVLIIIVVFAPIFSLQGVEGKLFHPMAQSIVFAMIASLIVALVVIPALATYFFKHNVLHKDSFIFRPIEKTFNKILISAMKTPKKIILGTLILFILTLGLVPFLGTEFVPKLEEGTLNIRTTLAPSVNLTTALKIASKLEKRLMSFPEVEYVSSRVGRPELGGDPEPVSNVELFVGLKPISQWTSASSRTELENLMENTMNVFPGLIFSFSQPIATRVDELLSGVKAQLAIKLFGPNLDVLSKKGKEIESIVKNIKGTKDVAMEQISGESQLVIKPNREALMRYGISVGQVMSLVSNQIGGKQAGQVINGNERYDIYVRLEKKYRKSTEAISNLLLQSPNGAWVKLKDVASVDIELGPPQIRRDNVQRRVVIQTNVEGRDMGSVVAEIKGQILKTVKFPSGYSVVYGGQFKNQERAQARLMIVVPISLALIFLLLYFAFHSMSQALLIMVNVPLALIGGIIGLFVSGQYLSVPGSIGFIALFGIAVLNGVVLINAINQNLEKGMSKYDAIFNGTFSRLRPVLLTAIIAALGLLPMLLSQGVGSEIQRPLATVVVGGLFSSTPLTLVVLPVLYLLFFVKKER
jgi:cobalt-zinc-cadmium resistance protein CzcA